MLCINYNMEYISKNIKDTHNIAEEVLSVLMQKKNTNALIIVLKGDLGAGKTEFVKGLKSFFKIKNNILSPTFVLMKVYDICNPQIKFKKIYHFDLYRLIDKKLNQKELEDSLNCLDIYDVLNDVNNIVLIEWGENIKMLNKFKKYMISFESCDDNIRKISIDL